MRRSRGSRTPGSSGSARRERYPASLAGFLARCHAHAQTRPTPLLLRYRGRRLQLPAPGSLRGGRLPAPGHRAALASRGATSTGGEFLLLEQRPRQQSRGEAIALEQGEAIVFPTRERPLSRAARRLPGADATWCERGALRRAHHARDHLPRRRVASGRGLRRRDRDRADFRLRLGQLRQRHRQHALPVAGRHLGGVDLRGELASRDGSSQGALARSERPACFPRFSDSCLPWIESTPLSRETWMSFSSRPGRSAFTR